MPIDTMLQGVTERRCKTWVIRNDLSKKRVVTKEGTLLVGFHEVDVDSK